MIDYYAVGSILETN